MAKKTPPSNRKMIEAARRQYEGALEIDDGAMINRAEGNPGHGAYVQAWVWVADEEVMET